MCFFGQHGNWLFQFRDSSGALSPWRSAGIVKFEIPYDFLTVNINLHLWRLTVKYNSFLKVDVKILGRLTAGGLHWGGGPQVGEVTRLGGVTSPTSLPPLPGTSFLGALGPVYTGWGTPGRWGNPLFHIISHFNLITFTWEVVDPATCYLTYLESPTSM